MPSYYVSLEGIEDSELEFLGYTLVAESENIKLYRDIYGDEHPVQKEQPRLYVEDVNDAQILAGKSSRKNMVAVPPKR